MKITLYSTGVVSDMAALARSHRFPECLLVGSCQLDASPPFSVQRATITAVS